MKIEIYDAVKVLHDYCEDRDCEECVFYHENRVVPCDLLRDAPWDWDLKEMKKWILNM